ncbi:MAG: putative bifunctional diguanylate cyclase/phosphodiesterase, partial [Janthinobacterium lividum]
MWQSTYNNSLVLVSLLIATLASYTALDLASHISGFTQPKRRRQWLAGGAIAMGLGIWSMHFVGMLAFSLPIELGYDITITAASLLIAIASSWFALSLMTRPSDSLRTLIGSGTLMGFGIAAMHYCGMAAMRMQPGIDYSPVPMLLSLLIAIAASIAAIWIARILRAHQGAAGQQRWLPRLGAAVVMGMAISGMHYTGMAAANFPIGAICGAASSIDVKWLALIVTITTMGILCIALLLSILGERLEANAGAFNESLKIANEKLQYQATHDALTGLPNRALLAERIQHAIDMARRTCKHFAVFFIDLDGFKAINDTLGHSVGDMLLKELALRLRSCVRREDLVVRLGGDEFVVMVENLPDVAMASLIAEKLFSCFAADFNLSGGEGMMVSPSIGISMFPENGDSMDVLLRHADAAMYQVKNSGRNDYKFFEASMNVASMRTIEIQRGLRGALKSDQMFLQYQPKFSYKGELTGLEALLRWQHPELGMVSPAEFIAIAERSGQIVEIGFWVIEEVCRQLGKWESEGLETVKVAINLSQIQMRSATLVDDILALTYRYGVEPARLMFEITESVAM